MEKLLTTKEVCELLGCKDPKGRWVRNLWKGGYIEGAKFGNKILYKETSVRDFINHQFKLQEFK